MTAIMSREWRDAHLRTGDEAAAGALRCMEESGGANMTLDRARLWTEQALAYAAIAQAHYAAANVRQRFDDRK
jgi:hypothetical protein